MKKTLSLLLMISSFFLSVQVLTAAPKENKLRRKLRTIVIDHIEVEDATVEAVIKLIRIRAKDLDPEKEGVNIVLFLDPPKKKAAAQKKAKKDAEEDEDDIDFLEEITDEATGENKKTVTLMFDDISLGEALKHICTAADLVYKVDRYAVVIAHKDFPLSKMETKIFPIDSDAALILKERLRR